ncbi:MAG: response regulator [Gammaproteobacteria bacterium]|nr:response regulator [Gammaproteobacteria bacterium]
MSLNKPVVLYRYETAEHLDNFKKSFQEDFTIVSCSDDEQALNEIKSPTIFCAVFIEHNNFSKIQTSNLYDRLTKSADQSNPEQNNPEQSNHFDLPVFVLAQAVQIDDIASVLKSHKIKKFYNKPYDTDQIRSDVFSAHLSRPQNTNPSEPSFIQPGNNFPYNNVPYNNDQCPKLGVLIVDDEVLATKYLVKQLQQKNSAIQIFVAANADEALKLLTTTENNIAVIISDHRMPGMKGEQLLNEIRQLHPNVIRILTSAYQEVDVALGAINNGQIYQYLKKPWNAHQVNQLINEALHQYQQQKDKQHLKQTELSAELSRLLERRYQNLLKSFDSSDSTSLGKVFPDFIEFLQSINPSIWSQSKQSLSKDSLSKQSSSNLTKSKLTQPKLTSSSQAAVRASKETNLEEKLLNDFRLKVDRWFNILAELQEETNFKFGQTIEEQPEFKSILNQVVLTVVDQLTESSGQINECSDQLNQTSGQLTETSDQLTETSDQIIETSGQFTETNNPKLNTTINQNLSEKLENFQQLQHLQQKLIEQIVFAIRQLLKGSNLNTEVFHKRSNTNSHNDFSILIESDPNRPFIVLKHLLSPLTSASDNFTDQQSALLLLFYLNTLSKDLVSFQTLNDDFQESGFRLILRAEVSER